MRRKPDSKAKSSRRLERHFGLKEASAILGLPPSTLKGYVAQGLVARVKMPGLRGKVLLPESALVELLERFREPARFEIEDALRRAETSPRCRRSSRQSRDVNRGSKRDAPDGLPGDASQRIGVEEGGSG